MSVRLFTIRLAKHGRYLLQSYWRRDIHTNIWEQQHNNAHKTRTRSSTIATAASATASQTAHFARHAAKHALKAVTHTTLNAVASNVPRSGIFRFGQHARKLFIDNILSRVTTTYSEELRQKATKKLFYGDSAPFFALVGVSLASGAGVLTKEDELEGVCWEIREAASRLQSSWNHDEISESLNSGFNVDKLDVGPPIAKGCAAVVYAASFKGDTDASTENSTQTVSNDSSKETGAPSPIQQQSYRPELMTPIQQTSRFVHNFGASVDNLHVYSQSSAAAAFVEELATRTKKEKQDEEQHEKGELPATLIPDALHKLQSATVSSHVNINRYPLALKLMFNYDIQSNALSILRAMYKETVPARQRHIHAAAEDWERLLSDQTLTLPPHPNIVCMYGFFCDEVRNFPDGHLLYPIAQPQRINPHGYGRNMSLYLLMKRYDYTLRSLLDTHQLSTRTKLLLLTQLFEAVAHINRHGIAHRDLKSDNILIELNDDQSPPVLVLSDFGCCLADKVHGLQLPYTSADIDKGGNAALMAPEIINKQPGPFAVLNYGKADLWACGAIAYEIFGLHNPFYSASGGRAAIEQAQTNSLRNSDYKEQELPALNDECPSIVQELILNILNPNPSKRVSPDIAANIMQLYLWAPSKWLKNGGMPNSPEILQWLLSLSTKVMCEGHPGLPLPVTSAFGNQYQLNYQQNGRRTYVEYLLICSFLSRAHLRRIRGALNWIQSVVA